KIKISAIKTSQNIVEEQLQQVKDQVKEIVKEELREFSAGECSLTAAASNLPDRHSAVVAKPYPYNGKKSWDIYQMQFEHIARINNWSIEEKACVLTSMLRDSAAAILENL
ncbi:unnamed protein product, partial [Callosobruchus maculatus]